MINILPPVIESIFGILYALYFGLLIPFLSVRRPKIPRDLSGVPFRLGQIRLTIVLTLLMNVPGFVDTHSQITMFLTIAVLATSITAMLYCWFQRPAYLLEWGVIW